MAKAMARLPQRVIWKMGDKEVAQAGGLSALNLTANIKVCPLTRPIACGLRHDASYSTQQSYCLRQLIKQAKAPCMVPRLTLGNLVIMLAPACR